jgi:hypothetical protein
MTGIGLIVENKNNGLEEKISEYASCYDEAWQLASVIDCERFAPNTEVRNRTLPP